MEIAQLLMRIELPAHRRLGDGRRLVGRVPVGRVVAKAVFAPVVDADPFERARIIVEDWIGRYDDAELLALLSGLPRATGALSSLVIDEREDMPSSSV